MSTTQIQKKEPKPPATTEIEAYVESAVVTNETEAMALDAYLTKQVNARKKAIEEWFAPIKGNAHRAWKALCLREGEALAGLKRALEAGNAKISAWRKEERIRREALQAEIAKRAQADAEKQALAVAQEIKETEGPEAAAEFLTLPVETVTPVVSVEPPKLPGTSSREYWSGEVTDLHALIRWCAEAPIERAKYLEPAQARLNEEATRFKSELAIPGVTPKSRESFTRR